MIKASYWHEKHIPEIRFCTNRTSGSLDYEDFSAPISVPASINGSVSVSIAKTGYTPLMIGNIDPGTISLLRVAEVFSGSGSDTMATIVVINRTGTAVSSTVKFRVLYVKS